MSDRSIQPRRAIGLCPLGFLDIPPPDMIAIAHEAGFASLSLRTRPATPGGPAFPLTGDLMARTRRALDQTGMRVTAIEQVGLSHETDVAGLRPMMEGGAAIGATRVLCSGDDADEAVVAARFAELCDLAAEHGMAVDMEFMAFRAVKTLEAANRVVAAAGRPNGFICLDSLHFVRSGGTVAGLAAVPPERIGSFQIADAPAVPPADLAAEARQDRLLPGDGELPLAAMLSRISPTLTVEAEIPLGLRWPDASPPELARRIAAATRAFLDRHDGAVV